MALAQQVTDSLDEASSALRNALAFAARQERPVVCNTISEILCRIDQLKSFDGILDKLDEMTEHGPFKNK
jgi:hypothetical protein